MAVAAAVVLAVALGLVAPASADAARVALRPAADADVSAAAPRANHGDAVRLRGDRRPGIRSYLRFRVGDLEGRLSEARLRLHSRRASVTGVRLHGVPDDKWGEGRLNYVNAPPLGPVADRSGRAPAGGTLTLDATAAAAGGGVVSVAIASRGSDRKAFASRETGRPPRLVVTTEDPAPPPPEPPTVAAAGDIACDPAHPSYNGGAGSGDECRHGAVSDLLVGGGYDAILPLGDLQYEDGALDKFRQSYDPTWGRVKGVTRPVPGNHEYRTAGASGYFDYFNGVGEATGQAGHRDRGYYSFDLGDWHVVALNSNCFAVGGCGPGSPQEQWLRADLAENASSCTLAYWHHPRFSSSGYGSNPATQTLWQALQEDGADVVLTGHSHNYERFGRQDSDGDADRTGGLRQFVVGTGGKNFYRFQDVLPNSAVRNADTHGVLELTLSPDRYAWRFLPAAGGGFTDSGSDLCEGALPDGSPPSTPTGLTGTITAENEVSLSWTASTDDDGVSGYSVLRDGTEVGSPSRSRYVDSSAQAGRSHTYQVRAVDPAGNVSAPSGPVTVTTRAVAPGASAGSR